MNGISFLEDHISQLPALMLLEKLGYTYITQAEALDMRGGNTSNVLLESILRRQLESINTLQVSSNRTALFTSQNIQNGIDALRNLPMAEGFMVASQAAYDLLTMGKGLEQSIDGDKKSFTLQYINWQEPEKNVFHVTEEFAVTRTGMSDTYRPDVVLFVNGIPFCIIECKRPDVKDSLQQAVSQHLRNQKEDGIRNLYVYSSLLISTNRQEVSYATTATPEKFWAKWREQFANDTEEAEYTNSLNTIVNHYQPGEKLFAERFGYVKSYFKDLHKAPIIPSEQDAYLFSLCTPVRLLELMYSFTLYDDGIKKVARYQQYFAVKKTIERVRSIDGGRRKGGVIWHTQGSGKSLTMVLIAQALVQEKSIKNPKIVLVTDRTELDGQITATFRKCSEYVENAKTGIQLEELLRSNKDAVVTTIINKFETAVNRLKKPLTDPNVFVLIDEGHRSQYGEMGVKMEKAMPNACFIAMTGTPLMKKEKSTAQKFGGIIKPVYTVDQAVKDGAVVPLLYEGRIVPQEVHERTIDKFFDKICEPLTEYQCVDLKKKFSRAEQLSHAEQRIYTIAWDISLHFRENWQGTKFKAQLVAPRKRIAILYKRFLDEIGIVTSEVLITSPDSREGEETAYGNTSNEELAFWKRMMDEHGTAKKYESNIINRFKNSELPEIIIVVDKLLTGFDEPKNTVLYLDRRLTDHTLLQAIARVNRVCDDKEFGYIIDYYGVLNNLNTALDLYADYDKDDLQGTFTDISEEIAKLPQKHSDVWDVFKSISNKNDFEAYSEHLRAENIRMAFYEKLTAFTKGLKVALSSVDFHKKTDQKEIDRYKKELTMFLKLRAAVQERYSDTIDYKQYEGQIQQLIDKHIESSEVKVITELVNIFDKEKFAIEVEKVVGKAAKADTIASRTAKYITENMDTDPAFYKKFSELLKETISAYEQGRIDQAEYLSRTSELMHNVLTHTDSEIPTELQHNEAATAYFGLSLEVFKLVAQENMPIDLTKLSLDTALEIDRIIKSYIFDEDKLVIDWLNKGQIIGKMKLEIEDYLIDEVKRKYSINITFENMDSIIDRSVEVAKRRFAQ